ncbi:MAG: hypothetical protein JW915_15170 [Chitinispirillaceae bacterium]|nr:hypothetical protein [Chitinispirillaceae bacterium]
MGIKEKSANTSTTHIIPTGGYPDCFFYDPGEQKYLVVNPAHIAQLVMNIKQLDNFQMQIANARAEKPSAKKTERLEGIGKYIDEHINGTTQKPVTKKGIAGLIPLLMTNGTVSLYDRPLVFTRRHDLDKMKWLDADDPEVAKRFKLINDRLEKRMENALKTRKKKEEESKSKTGKEKQDALKEKWAAVETSCGWKLWTLKNKDGKPFDGRLVKNWILQPDSELGKDSRYFSAKPEIQFLRYTLGAEAGAKWDPKGGSIKLAAEGNAKFNIVDAKVTGDMLLPSKDGVDLFGLVRAITNKAKVERALKANAKFFVRLKFSLSGFAYAGVSVSASVAIPEIDYSDYIKKRQEIGTAKKNNDKKEVKAKVGVEGELFAGAKAGISLAEEVEWHDGSKTPADFSTLAGLKWTGTGQIGIGIGGALALRYENGSFTFEIYLQVTLKLGLSGKFEVEVDIEQAYKILTHLARSVEYHKIPGLTAEGFKKLADYGLAKAINAKNMAIDAWDSAYQATAKAAEQTYESAKIELLEKRKEIEDTIKVLYNDVNEAKKEILEKLYKEQDELEARLVKVRNECLRKKKEFCKEIEGIAKQVSDFKSWFKSASKEEINEIRKILAQNVNTWNTYFQMLLPETAGPIIALLGGGKSLQSIESIYQNSILAIADFCESTHERVHFLDNFARELLDVTITNNTQSVSEGKRIISKWLEDLGDVASDLYHDITD